MTAPPAIRGGVLRWLRDRLVEPRLLSVAIGGDLRIDAHRQILRTKPALQQLFGELYRLCLDLDRHHLAGAGRRVELGAGSSFFKEVSPDLVTTDVQLAPHLDMVVDALRLPFRAASVRAFYAIECFHHFADPDLFFAELQRTLVPGGGCILVEPYHGPVARQLYRRLFDSESFEPEQPEWRTPATGPMLGANQALSYIVFTRDRAKFHAKYPALRIVREFPMNNYLRYLGSGGVNFRNLLPTSLVPLARLCEKALVPIRGIVALHHVIVLRYEPTARC